jgi:hypothetical protein
MLGAKRGKKRGATPDVASPGVWRALWVAVAAGERVTRGGLPQALRILARRPASGS